MNRLCLELFDHVMDYLPLIDKLKCNIVCKKWNQQLSSHKLYSKVSFNNEAQLLKGLDFFEKNTAYGQLTQKLFISDLEITDPATYQSVVSLFPNVQNVVWRVRGLVKCGYTLNLSEAWSYVKSMTIPPSLMELSVFLTIFRPFKHLKFIDVDFDSMTIGNEKHFISQMRHTSCLETLIIQDASLTLLDMEELHYAVPYLKRLELVDSRINTNEKPVKITSPAEHITDLRIYNWYIMIDSSDTPNVIEYIGAKYTNVENLSLSSPQTDETWEEDLILYSPLRADYNSFFKSSTEEQCISNLKHLKSYQNSFCGGVTQQILYTMDSNNIRLKNIHLEIKRINVSGHGGLRSFIVFPLDSLMSSQQAKSIQDITILFGLRFTGYQELSRIVEAVTHSVNNLQSLVSLTLKDFYKSNWSLAPFFSTIENISTLEKLTIDGLILSGETVITIPSDPTSDRSHFNLIDFKYTKSNNLKTLNIVDLQLRIPWMFACVNTVNIFFYRLLELCTNLQSVSISGDKKHALYAGYDSQSYVNLDFTKCIQLKSLTIDLAGFHYYKFDDIIEKKGMLWNDYYHKASIADDSTTARSKLLNLSWTGRLNSLNLRYLSPTSSKKRYTPAEL